MSCTALKSDWLVEQAWLLFDSAYKTYCSSDHTHDNTCTYMITIVLYSLSWNVMMVSIIASSFNHDYNNRCSSSLHEFNSSHYAHAVTFFMCVLRGDTLAKYLGGLILTHLEKGEASSS